MSAIKKLMDYDVQVTVNEKLRRVTLKFRNLAELRDFVNKILKESE